MCNCTVAKAPEATELRNYEAASTKLRYYSATVDSQNCSLRSLPVVVATAKSARLRGVTKKCGTPQVTVTSEPEARCLLTHCSEERSKRQKAAGLQ